MTSALPSRPTVRAHLHDLATGKATREEVADWAQPWVIGAEPDVEVWDHVVWRALTQLCGADLRVSPTDYLHSILDFICWLNDFDSEKHDPEM